VIQYYCQYPDEISKLDQFRLSSLRGGCAPRDVVVVVVVAAVVAVTRRYRC
jgi:hypothetical protein